MKRVIGYLKQNWLKLYFMLVVLLLVFLVGVYSGFTKTTPVKWIYQGYVALQDWIADNNFKHYTGVRPEKFIRKARKSNPGSGVTLYQPGEAYEGLTLISSMWDHRNGLDLLAMDGEVLHSWRVSLSDVWAGDSTWPEEAMGDWGADIHGAVLFPDGSVVFNFEYVGLVKVDQCSNVIWKLNHATHHAVHVDEEGFIWVPGRKRHRQQHEKYPLLKPGIEEDLILKVSPDGKIVKTIPLLETLYRSDMAGVFHVDGHKVDSTFGNFIDVAHLNDIEILPSHMADQFPLFNAGDILISLRNLNAVMVLDGETEKVKWSIVGPFVYHHDPDFLADGTIGLFDNRGDLANRGEMFNEQGIETIGSRILKIDPVSRNSRVVYQGDKNNKFDTYIRGKQQFLANGNLLITEWLAGRVFEVNKRGEIVWNYINRYDDDEIYHVSEGARYERGYVDFLKKKITCRQ